MSTTTHHPAGPTSAFPTGMGGNLRSRVADAVERAAESLLAKRHPDGHWCAELEGDSILITEYLLMKAILGQLDPPEATPEDRRRFDKMLVYLRRLQCPDGTWGQYPGAPPDLSATVKAYLTLKIVGGRGGDRDAPHMRRAREAVLALGGAEHINTFSNFYLACLGQVSWDACPTIPPEIALLPRWFPFHMTKVAAWTRTMILPLAICSVLRPVRRIPSHRGCAELFKDHSLRNTLTPATPDPDPLGWTNIFLGVDKALKIAQRRGLTPWRATGLARAEQWILDRINPETTDGLGAIFPPMVYVQIALQALGYERSHPVIQEAERQLDRFFVEEEDHVRVQPCFSPVWDTGIALYALTEAGYDAGDERIAHTCRWLLDNEVTLRGDWFDNLRPEDRKRWEREGARGGGWAFEYKNDWYPDVDDTAMVAKALRRATGGIASPGAMATARRGYANATSTPESNSIPSSSLLRHTTKAASRAIRWILAMQNDDGGWAAFDRTKHRAWMEHVPFADHNAMQDPSCADITGRTIESLITNGLSPDHPAIRRAVEYLKREQHPRGSWFGRWGVNHIYGTWQATGGLAAAGENTSQLYLRKTLSWLRSIQNPDGGFGESANSYLDDSLAGIGPSAASQTAWAVTAMMFLLPRDQVATDPHVTRAIEYLLETQLHHDAPPDFTTGAPGGMPGSSRYGEASRTPGPLGAMATARRGHGNTTSAPEALDPAASRSLHGAHVLPEPTGSWREHWFTGTGFPKVFYLRYHLYRHYFPLMALARYRRLAASAGRE